MLLYLLLLIPLIFLLFFYFYKELDYIYKHIDIFLFLYKLNKDYKEKKYLKHEDVLVLKNKINNLGVIAIKIVQWSLTRLKLLKDPILEPVYDLFDSFYEECEYHDDIYTMNRYFEDFKRHINHDYQITRIASGSIAQVYKGHHMINSEVHAIKCVHPYILKKILLSKYIVKSFLWLLVNFNIIYINLDVNEFFDSIEKQANMENEAYNLKRFYDNYKDNQLIIIPKLINHSTHFLIMEYIEAEKYDNIKMNQYQQMKLLNVIDLFSNNTMLIDRFVHADLHDGNWKVKYDEKTNKYKLVILDFGLCLNLEDNIEEEDKNWIIDLMNGFELNNLDQIIDIILISLKNKQDKENTKKNIKQFFIDNDADIYKLDPENILSLMYQFFQQFRVQLNSTFITFILCIFNYKNIIIARNKNLIPASSSYDDREILKEFSLIYVYPLHIEFCKHHNIFPELCKYMQEAVKKKTKKTCEFEELEKKLNMDDFDEISVSSSDDE